MVSFDNMGVVGGVVHVFCFTRSGNVFVTSVPCVWSLKVLPIVLADYLVRVMGYVTRDGLYSWTSPAFRHHEATAEFVHWISVMEQ